MSKSIKSYHSKKSRTISTKFQETPDPFKYYSLPEITKLDEKKENLLIKIKRTKSIQREINKLIFSKKRSELYVKEEEITRAIIKLRNK